MAKYRPLMIRWNLGPHMAKRGWENANQLAIGAGVSYPVANRALKGDPLERIEVETLERFARAFHCKPWQLLEHTP